ncbi:Uncharacterized protein TCM_044043 [Theobroma cacao]|uniref:Uncharacterized protein n=1 Tax=Theobroma cacao TaxID=3641 RepID=A0A061FWM1_THECC|nr:Uncharacterized protein TCM_044043 [Theobroma cacao]
MERVAPTPQAPIDRENFAPNFQSFITDLKGVIHREVKMVKTKANEESTLSLNLGLYPINRTKNTLISYNTTTPWKSKLNILEPAMKKKRGKSKLVAREITSFRLSDERFDLAQIEKHFQMSLDGKEKEFKYLLIERLDGWKIDCKKRATGKVIDMYYTHEISKKSFRSVKEVMNFILYEVDPRKR